MGRPHGLSPRAQDAHMSCLPLSATWACPVTVCLEGLEETFLQETHWQKVPWTRLFNQPDEQPKVCAFWAEETWVQNEHHQRVTTLGLPDDCVLMSIECI